MKKGELTPQALCLINVAQQELKAIVANCLPECSFCLSNTPNLWIWQN